MLTLRKGFEWKFGEVQETPNEEPACDTGKGKHPVRSDIKPATTLCKWAEISQGNN